MAAARAREQSKGSYRISKEPGIVPHRATGTYSKFLVQARFGPSVHVAGDVAAPTQSSTQKAASHLNRLGRSACGASTTCAVREGARRTFCHVLYPPLYRLMLGEITKEQGRVQLAEIAAAILTRPLAKERSTAQGNIMGTWQTSWQHGNMAATRATWGSMQGDSQDRTFAMLLTLLTFVARAADAPAATLAAATCTALCTMACGVRHD